MRLAVAGKGGAGKTTLSATLSRLAGRAGLDVVAVDADANPNLAAALGVDRAVAAMATAVPPAQVSRRRGGTGLLCPIADVLDAHALAAPDGVRLMTMGAPQHAEQGCLCSAHAVVSGLLEDLGGDRRFVVVDMEASPEHLSRGTVRHVDEILLVAEPYYRSLETVRRMSLLAAELPVAKVAVVANKIRRPDDLLAVQEFCGRHGLSCVGAIPYSDEVVAADGAGVPLIEWPGGEGVVAAVEALRTAVLTG